MAEEYMPGISDDAAKIKADRKKLKADQKAQKKEAKKRAKELAAREEELDEDSSGPVIITTLVIIVVWVGIICALVKLDIGGFGSQVLAPVLNRSRLPCMGTGSRGRTAYLLLLRSRFLRFWILRW